MRFDFLGLEAFLGIADRGSFQRAAAHLNLSQTALSHRMKKLEDDLGLKLFTRTTRHVTLTPAGLELLPRARQMMEDMAASYEALRQRGRAQQKQLAIACLPSVATHVLPPLVAAFRASRPDLVIRVHDTDSNAIAELVQSGNAEFGVTIVSANRWDLEITPLLRESYVLVGPAAHPLLKERQVAWADLANEPLIRVSSQTGNRAIIDDALGTRREQLHWCCEVQQVATAISLVRSGAGLTIVPRLAIDLEAAPDLGVVPMRNPVVTRTIGIVTKRGLPVSPAGEELRAMVEARLRPTPERQRQEAQEMYT